MLTKNIHIVILCLSLTMFAFTKVYADVVTPQTEENNLSEEENNFNVKSFAFAHILDSYEFHITNIGEISISVPLPIIIKSSSRGWFIFLSSKFHHGKESHKNFSIAERGPYAYKIVETLSDGTVVRPLDLSLTKAGFSLIITVILLCCIFIPIAKKYKQNPYKAPSGLQSLMEPLVLFVLNDVIKSALGREVYKKYAAYLLTLFFFILTLNLTGLIPIFPFGASTTGNIVIPAVLAFITCVLIYGSSTKGYWHEMLWPPDVPLWLKFPLPIMPFIELLSSITKPIVLMMRLFANMMAGHLLTIVMMSLIFIFGAMSPIIADTVTIVTILITILMTLLHILVAVIQAYIFTLLSSVFISMARVKEHKKKEHPVREIKA